MLPGQTSNTLVCVPNKVAQVVQNNLGSQPWHIRSLLLYAQRNGGLNSHNFPARSSDTQEEKKQRKTVGFKGKVRTTIRKNQRNNKKIIKKKKKAGEKT